MSNLNITIESEEIEPDDNQPGLIQRVFNYQNLSSMFRILGSGVLVASLSILLFRGWEISTDISRFYTLLAFSGSLATLGFLVSRFIRENKGARTFLAIAVGAIAVNFTVLGALAYSTFIGPDVQFPEIASWIAPDTASVTAAIGATLLAAVPIVYFGFSVFARQSAKRLTILYIVSNLALLVPVRAGLWIGLIGLGIALLILNQLIAARRSDSGLSTFEGKFATLIQFLPLGILFGRNLYLHSVDEFFITLISVIVYVALREWTKHQRIGDERSKSPLAMVLQTATAISIGFGTAAIAMSINMADVFIIPILSLVSAGLFADMAITHAGSERRYGRAAAVLISGGFLLNLMYFPGVGTAFAAAVTGLMVSIYGYSAEQKSVFIAGLVGLLAGLAYQLLNVAVLFSLGNWGGLALIGIVSILVASLLERHGVAIRNRIIAWRKQFTEWDY